MQSAVVPGSPKAGEDTGPATATLPAPARPALSQQRVTAAAAADPADQLTQELVRTANSDASFF